MKIGFWRLPRTIAALLGGMCAWSGSAASATLYIEGFPEAEWRQLGVAAKAEVLAKTGVAVYLGGPIVKGDFEQLQAIQGLVPVHSLHYSSPGGSVSEALRILGFVQAYSVAVATDYGCEGGKRRYESSLVPVDGYCGCGSACALIWLAAPKRSGAAVMIHRPYFERDEFADLPDEKALEAYALAGQQVRAVLKKVGYSDEFIARLFRTPRENFFTLDKREIERLPVDTPLDELVSTRCYGERGDALARYHALEHEIAELNKKYKALSASLRSMPDDGRAVAEWMKDPEYGPILREQSQVWKDRWEREREISNLTGIIGAFESCKEVERIKISLRKSNDRIDNATREKLESFAEAVRSKATYDGLVGERPSLKGMFPEPDEEVRRLAVELEAELPAAHWKYIVD